MAFHNASAQVDVLHQFAVDSNDPDGGVPEADLVLSGNVLYGTAYSGGTYGQGSVFAVNTDGTYYPVLHSFTGVNGDGSGPEGGLLLWGDTLYGTAAYSANDCGTVFKIRTNGTGYSTIYAFTGPDGARPAGNLLLSGNMLYGTTAVGGATCGGTVFRVDTNGNNFLSLHTFTAEGDTNGCWPPGGLVLSGGMLYGVATVERDFPPFGGSIFAISTNGDPNFTILHRFWTTNGHGVYPAAGLLLVGNTLYGTTSGGGTYGSGTVFAINTDGSGYRVVCNLGGGILGGLSAPSSPMSDLKISGNTLYGTTWCGGLGGGTVFAINTDGSGFTTIYNIGSCDTMGPGPLAGMILSGGVLYTTTSSEPGCGWSYGSPPNGDVFSVPVGGVGNIYVADHSDADVAEFGSNESFITSFGKGALNTPEGIAIDSGGDVYVTDGANHQVQVFFSCGNLMATFGGGNLVYPVGIAIDGSENILVVDKGSQSVAKFDRYENYITNFGSEYLNTPQCVAVDNNTGNIYVTDSGNNCVVKFSSSGSYISPIITGLHGPFGIAVIGIGVILVVENVSHEVAEYSMSGSYSGEMGLNALSVPWGIALAPSGNVYVTDSGHKAVIEFNGSGTEIASFGGGQLAYPIGIAIH